jgi:hypothetical protein
MRNTTLTVPKTLRALFTFALATGCLTTPGWAQVPAQVGAPGSGKTELGPGATAPTVLGKPVDERTLRQAARPFRWILEADTSRRTVPGGAAPATTPTTASAVPVPRVAAPRPGGPEASLRSPGAGSGGMSESGQGLPPKAPQPDDVAQNPQAWAQELPGLANPPAAAEGKPAAAAVPPSEAAGKLAAHSSPAPEAAPLRAQLRTMVEPEVPDSLLRRRPKPGTSPDGQHRVMLDVEIGTDGRVQAATVRQSTNPALDDLVRVAVLAWVYAPLPQPVTERLELRIAER